MKSRRPIFVGTFHKTGTVLMSGIFRGIAKELDLKFLQPDHAFWKQKSISDVTFDIFCDRHSTFLRRPAVFPSAARCCISIRDPRDVVISAAGYHVDSKETWLHKPEEKFGGKSHQQALCALPPGDERFLFEMDNSAARIIQNMLKVDRSDPRIMLTRLDRLMVDYELEEYRRIFTFLGFEGEGLDVCLAIARKRSVFSRQIRPGGHVRNTTPALWKHQFSPAVAAEFEKRFPGAAEKLGYEPTFSRQGAETG